ncbi:unnamed protein product [Aphanomyces euteiches]|uniref:GPI mannosyltransferase 1 n=1 Tax=Aphanomyces euteiches TaxID=100861 RepID=A0A6G0XKK4_9STRA|nr:hypothetical protein Ae201684_003816 [Aphanomyces euteiches]KAH9084510.1 hypothetical protein Ae201684P_001752 [Aphanomyces euteiches]KAH9145799.1 hypothetical protein AeRB84_010307 [Aphanomyces euteiches]
MQARTVGIFAIGLVVRLAFVLWAEYQDRTMPVKYTDVDYDVYTDASREVVQGNSPFDRTTYRYTPLLAYMLLPNIYVHEAWGKLLFVASDMVVGYLLYAILKLRSLPESSAINYTMWWLYHPFSVNISTRGNADTIVVLLCLLTIYFLMKKQLVLSAIFYGLAVHFKIYPIVYALSFLVFLDEDFDASVKPIKKSASIVSKCIHWLNGNRLAFGLISGGLFVALTAFFYVVYGYTFLYEAYLYHFTRTDNRHNFSMYFYDLYLRYGTSGGLFMGLVAFLPQFLTLFNISLRCGKDLIFAQFLLTITFVVFNKVCTAQYFLWYSVFLPLVLPTSELSGWQGVAVIAAWFGGELHWLYWAFGLEILGQNTFFQLWIAGLVFFCVNVAIMVLFIKKHHHGALFAGGRVVALRKAP